MAIRNFDYPRFIKTWREYCNNASFSGLYLIGGFSKISKLNRLFYLFLYIVMCAYCTYRWVESIQEYRTYQLKTTIMYNLRPELMFPAITIANINLVRRTAYLSSREISLLYAAGFYTDSFAELLNRSETFDKSCMKKASNVTTKQKSTKQNKEKTKSKQSKGNVQKLRDESVKNDTDAALFYVLKEFIAMDSRLLLLKCKWASVDVNCSDIFYNHMIDYRMHFSFNLHPDALLAHESSDLQSVVLGYGMNLDGFKLKSVNKVGKRYGLQLVFDDKQYEHCGVLKDAYNGAGFRILIHDPNTLTFTDMRDGLFLAPGFEYNIELRAQKFEIRTESLGRCRSKVTLWMEHFNRTEYTQHKCYFFCLIDKVFKMCKCRWETMSAQIAKEWSGVDDMPSCFSDPLKYFYCAKKIIDALQYNLLKECPECKRPCLETKYTFNLYAKRLTEQYLTSLLNKTMHAKNRLEFFKKNHLVANFYFGDMEEVKITEDLKMSSLDLFRNLGGTVGLLIGASVMTFYEILHQIIFSILESYKQVNKKLRKRRKKRRKIQ